MPKIPIYEQQVGLKPLKTAPVDQNSFTAGGRMMSETGKQLDDIATKFYELDVMNKTNKAKVNLHADLEKLNFEADADQEIETIVPRYQQKIDEAIAKHLSTVPAGQPRTQATEDFRLKGYNAFSTIRSNARTRQIGEARKVIEVDVAQQKKSYVTLATPEERTQAIKSATDTVNEAVLKGIYTPADAKKINQGILEDWEKARATFDAETSPERYNKSEYLLSSENRADTDKIADRIEAQQKKAAEVAKQQTQKNNALTLTKAMYEGKVNNITINDIYDRIEAEELPAEFGEAYVKAQTAPYTEEEIDKKPFAIAMENIQLDTNLSEDQKQKVLLTSLTDVLNLRGEGRIDQERLNVMMQFMTEKLFKPNAEPGWWESITSAIKSINAGGPLINRGPGAIAKNNLDFMKRVNNDETPEQAKNAVNFTSSLSVNPYLKNLSDKGTILVDPVSGMKRKYFSNGTYEDVQ